MTTNHDVTPPPPIARKFALRSLGPGLGKYLLYSNDGCHVYVLARYEELPGQLYTGDGTIEITGVFWRTLRIKPDSGLLSYEDEGAPGRSRVTGIPDPQRLIDKAVDLDTTMFDEVATLLPSRTAAIQVSLTRYVARKRPFTGETDWYWGVYDTITRSWPVVIAGMVVADMTPDQDKAAADADMLNRTIA